jgi:hypothetical protein
MKEGYVKLKARSRGFFSARLFIAGTALLFVATAGHAQLAGDGSAQRLPVERIRLMNYYPAANGWTYMWDRWDPATIEQDFIRIAGMNFNTVRINVLIPAFALPTPSSTALSRLAEVVQLADRHGLRIQLGLFDWLNNFTSIEDSKRWIDAVVGPFKDDPRIAFIDLRNELDTADPAQFAWARALMPSLKSAAGSIPVTVSVTAQPGHSVLQHLQELRAAGIPLDMLDVHVYGNAAAAYSKLRDIVEFAGNLPVIIGEAGYSSYAGYQPNDPEGALFGEAPNRIATEAMQAYQLKTLSFAAKALGLPVIAPWAYSDFTATAIPPSSTASNPREYYYGLLRTDTSEKPAAGFMRAVNAGAALSDDFNNGFEQTDPSGLPVLWRLWTRPCDSAPKPGCGFQADFAVDRSLSYEGAVSARISNGISNQYGIPGYFLSPPIVTVPGQSYSVTAFTRGDKVRGVARINISWYTQSGCFIASEASPSLPPGSSDWTPLSVTFTLPKENPSGACGGDLPAYVEIHLESGAPSPAGGGTVWFDDVQFRAMNTKLP